MMKNDAKKVKHLRYGLQNSVNAVVDIVDKWMVAREVW